MNSSHNTIKQWRIIDLLPALAVFMVGLTALAYAMLLPKSETGQFGVLLQPWSDSAKAIAIVNQTNAQILSFNERMNVLVVYS